MPRVVAQDGSEYDFGWPVWVLARGGDFPEAAYPINMVGLGYVLVVFTVRGAADDYMDQGAAPPGASPRPVGRADFLTLLRAFDAAGHEYVGFDIAPRADRNPGYYARLAVVVAAVEAEHGGAG